MKAEGDLHALLLFSLAQTMRDVEMLLGVGNESNLKLITTVALPIKNGFTNYLFFFLNYAGTHVRLHCSVVMDV